ncbi:hypothetical protein BJ684DRAFT_19748 [Piptocephalis cylindrospora]|uniref:Uncharacterized protein n=1 Tax=Piptocephalis cylindrospora TaxID=1907219 RepID=A0A4P9Y6C9_9FUNG|nr:hypothetical protein BJ684DRAFT_19748 [Piptocephalis cylindrospora]|eukprot:RKP13791.1 hypothetical protein BJ684DRAFT_19748 [Piptocephalis cylindrospora]
MQLLQPSLGKSALASLLSILALALLLFPSFTLGKTPTPRSLKATDYDNKLVKDRFASRFSRPNLQELLRDADIPSPPPIGEFSVAKPKRKHYVPLNPLLIHPSVGQVITFDLVRSSTHLQKRGRKYTLARKIQNVFMSFIIALVQIFMAMFGWVKDKVAMTILIDVIFTIIVGFLTAGAGAFIGTLAYMLASGLSAIVANEAVAAMDAKEQGTWVDWATFEKTAPERWASDMAVFAFAFAGAFVFQMVGKVGGLVVMKAFFQKASRVIGRIGGVALSPVTVPIKWAFKTLDNRLGNALSKGAKSGWQGVKGGWKGFNNRLDDITYLGTKALDKTRQVTYSRGKSLVNGVKGLGKKTPDGALIKAEADMTRKSMSAVNHNPTDAFSAKVANLREKFNAPKLPDDPYANPSLRFIGKDANAIDMLNPPGIWKTIKGNTPRVWFKKVKPGENPTWKNNLPRFGAPFRSSAAEETIANGYSKAYRRLSRAEKATPEGLALKADMQFMEERLALITRHKLLEMTKREVFTALKMNTLLGGAFSFIMWVNSQVEIDKMTMKDMDPWYVTSHMVYPVTVEDSGDTPGGVQWYVSKLPGINDESQPIKAKDEAIKMTSDLKEPFPGAIRLDTLEPPPEAKTLNAGYIKQVTIGKPDEILGLTVSFNTEVDQVMVSNMFGAAMTLGLMPGNKPNDPLIFGLLFWSKQLDDGFYIKYFPSNDTLLSFDGLDRPIRNFASKDGVLLQGQTMPKPPSASLIEAYQKALYTEQHEPGPDGQVHYDWASISSVASSIEAYKSSLGAAPTMSDGKLDVDVNGAHLTLRQPVASSTADDSAAAKPTAQPGASVSEDPNGSTEPSATPPPNKNTASG